MVTVDIKNVQQMLQKKITFGHTKCYILYLEILESA